VMSLMYNTAGNGNSVKLSWPIDRGEGAAI